MTNTVFGHYRCRSCGSGNLQLVVDIGFQPLANSYLRPEGLSTAEATYPLTVLHCEDCHLVQIPAVTTAHDIFSDYLYMSSYSQGWLDHSKRYVDTMERRFSLDANSRVVEVASNDGYLLQYVVAKGIPALGVEPAANVAEIAIANGVPTQVDFFGVETATKLVADGWAADLTAANNVLAHVPDINDFVSGFKVLLKPEGVSTFEFPHLLNMIEKNQFDTIYHEHFSYISLIAAQVFFARAGLRVFDVEDLPTHGGSLRLFVCHQEASHVEQASVSALVAREKAAGLDLAETYARFAAQCRKVKNDLLTFLIGAARDGKTVCGYGAPAKGNTLLNFCGARTDFISFTVDRNPHKQNHFLPGTRIEIRAPEAIAEAKPDYVIILPWNLRDEVSGQLSQIRDWGGKFVVAVPELEIF